MLAIVCKLDLEIKFRILLELYFLKYGHVTRDINTAKIVKLGLAL